MKNCLIPVFLCFALNAFASESSPISSQNTPSDNQSMPQASMVVEGRTWWYNVEYTMPWFESHEFGVRIGEEVVIDGVAWRTMELVGGYERHRTTDPLKGEELEMSEWKAIDKNGMILGYIREEDNTVFTKETRRTSGYEALRRTYSVLVDYHEGVNKLYRFGKPGDVFAVGEDSYYHNFEITSAETIESVGREYTLYNTEWISTYPESSYSSHIASNKDIFSYIEGIGPTDGTIFGPVGDFEPSIPFWTIPRLRYVTEGEDNEIIFEYLGGEKAWELSGVDAPIADDLQNTPKQWFNLQGIAIEQPSTPGVYIIKQGNKTFKTRIR